jgi:anti-sigma B factor antagonist
MDHVAKSGGLETLTVTDETGATVVTVGGEIDLTTADEVRAAAAAIVEGPPVTMIFDLAAVSFMDSSGVAVLVEAANAGHAVTVRRPSPAVLLVLRATGLEGLLTVEEP